MADSAIQLEHGAGIATGERVLYGLLAQFEEPEQLVGAAERAREAGYRKMDAYSSFPVEGLSEALGHRDVLVPYIMLIGGIAGAILGFGMLYYTMVISYPMNVGGRPLYAWPYYIPITFECTVLLSALSGLVGMCLLNGFPQPYHPVFNVPEFERASVDGFFLCIEADDPNFDRDETRRFMESLGAVKVTEVEERKP